MRKADFLLELGCEELPARFLPSLKQELCEDIVAFLEQEKVTFGRAESYATPRRLAVSIEQVSLKQGQRLTEIRGPSLAIAKDSTGSWTRQASGFAKKYGLSAEDLNVREVKGTEYLFAQVSQKGNSTTDLLASSLPILLDNLKLPNSMRFGINNARFLRPVRWILALHGDVVIPMKWADLQSGRTTRGHRFLGRVVEISEPSTYLQQLREQYVLADRVERRTQISMQLQQLAKKENFIVDTPLDLLEEVTDIVEFPTAFVGDLPAQSIELPEEVLLTTMRIHQRYFSVRSTEDKKILPLFIAVRNGNDENIEMIAQGNERVIASRLADANFFYQADKQRTLEDHIASLDKIIYHEKLGSVLQRVKRMGNLANNVGPAYNLDAKELKLLLRAVELCKCDLSTMMVNEYPELEGTIGAHYARVFGESDEVINSIAEHLMPKSSSDDIPGTKLGIILSLIDKFEMITAYFAAGIRPTGSQDPYGLRRRAQAVVTTLLQPEWSQLSTSYFFNKVIDSLVEDRLLKASRGEVIEALQQFFHLRMVSLLEIRPFRQEVKTAVLAGDITVPYLVLSKGELLEKLCSSDDLKTHAEAFVRVAKITSRVEEKKEVYPPSLRAPAEIDLYRCLQEAREKYDLAHTSRNAQGMYDAITILTEPIHRFFAEVLVMVQDEQIKQNRLVLLKNIMNLTSSFADLSHIITKDK